MLSKMIFSLVFISSRYATKVYTSFNIEDNILDLLLFVINRKLDRLNRSKSHFNAIFEFWKHFGKNCEQI